jgi:hypothetical protein
MSALLREQEAGTVRLGISGSPIRTNLVTGLSLLKFDIGAPEEKNPGTG